MSENTDTHEDLSGLKNKITELLGTIKSEKARADKAEREREEAAESAATANSTEIEKMQKRAEKAERELEAANKLASDHAQALRNTRADHSIAKAIAEANVDAKHVRAATALLKLDMSFDDEGNALIEGKSVQDYAKAYFAKDGLTYVRAADNGGGTASGNTSTKPPAKLTARPTTSAEWDILDGMDKTERNAFADSIGAPDLKV